MFCHTSNIIMPDNKFTLELCPPLNPTDIPTYFESNIKQFIKYTKLFTITSHPNGQISGFDRAYNLAKYLLSTVPDINIRFTITCDDLNTVNISSRLTQLKEMSIKKLLVVTGHSYTKPDKNPELHYANSTDLLQHIVMNYADWFESIAVTVYPSYSLDGSTQDETARVVEKLKLSDIIDTVFTQCIYEVSLFESLRRKIKTQVGDRYVQVVPSLAIFDSHNSLIKCLQLTKCEVPGLQVCLNTANEPRNEGPVEYSKELIPALYRSFLAATKDQGTAKIDDSNEPCPKELYHPSLSDRVHICPFGLFNFTRQIIEQFETL